MEVLWTAAFEVALKEMLLLQVLEKSLNLTLTEVDHLGQNKRRTQLVLSIYSSIQLNYAIAYKRTTAEIVSH
jgi:hypothetical protein